MNDTMTTSNIFDVLKELLSTNQSRFVSLIYKNKQNEVGKYLVHLNVNYKKVVQRDLKVLSSIVTTNELENEVKNELIESLSSTLDNNNTRYTKKDYYTHLTNSIKYHENNLYINSFVMSKVVIEPVEYKKVNSSLKTITKNRFRKLLKVNKFREFCLDMSQIKSITLNNKTLVIE